MVENKVDALIISDLHLGSKVCQYKELISLLEQILSGEIKTDHLILNGDVFDSHDFRRLNKHHWKVLSLLRKLSDRIYVIWICGNHDGPAEIVSHLLGISVVDEYTIESAGRKILILHGHQFDHFIEAKPILTAFADMMYRLLQRIDTTHTVARIAKHNSKTFLRCAEKIEEGALKRMKERNCHAVCCGHTHLPICKSNYCNSGCWTEIPCHYLTINDGHVSLGAYQK